MNENLFFSMVFIGVTAFSAYAYTGSEIVAVAVLTGYISILLLLADMKRSR
jgi:hypothetical protein